MAIVTSKFRVSAASGFASTFQTDNIYMVLARPQPWNDTSYSTTFANQASGTVTDNNPPNPTDNYSNEYALWRDAMAGVKINYSDVKLAVPKNVWSYGNRYDMYRHNVSAAEPTENSNYDLNASNFIVYVTSTGCVYKCLYNGRNGINTTGIVSTAMPTTTGTAPQITADGYIWKYLYQITAADADFITENYIPVVQTTTVNSINGIEVVLVSSGGVGYSTVPTIKIYGDGTGCTATAVLSGSSVTRIDVTQGSEGRGYTWAKVVLEGGGPVTTTANAIAIIAPAGGHGSNTIYETMAHNVMIAGTVSGYQNQEFPVNQDFRTVALIKNPKTYAPTVGWYVTSESTLSTFSSNTGRIIRTLTMTSTATTAPANDLVISGSSSNATGLMVFQSSTTTNLEYIQPVQSDNPVAIGDSSFNASNQLRTFTTGDGITAAGYASQEVISTTARAPEIHPYTGQMLYLDYRQPVTRSANQNEKINIVINF